jgi:hypothetical protein
MAIRHISLGSAAAKLRFKSPGGRDRLEVTDGKVNPQQLQTMRVLTDESVGLLTQALGTPVLVPRPGKRKGSKNVSTVAPIAGSEGLVRSTKSADKRQVLAVLGRLQAAGRTSSDLILNRYRNVDRSEVDLNGLCYVLSECLYHLFPAILTPYRISWGDGNTHWFLRDKEGKIIDPISEDGREICAQEEYALAREAAFLTKAPSKRAVELFRRAGIEDRGAST